MFGSRDIVQGFQGAPTPRLANQLRNVAAPRRWQAAIGARKDHVRIGLPKVVCTHFGKLSEARLAFAQRLLRVDLGSDVRACSTIATKPTVIVEIRHATDSQPYHCAIASLARMNKAAKWSVCRQALHMSVPSLITYLVETSFLPCLTQQSFRCNTGHSRKLFEKYEKRSSASISQYQSAPAAAKAQKRVSLARSSSCTRWSRVASCMTPRKPSV
jgi:hypothetical protein